MGKKSERLERIIAMFQSAGIAPDMKPDIIGWLWVHFAIDAGMIGTALFPGGFPIAGDTSEKTREKQIRTIRAVKDAFSVLEKRGLDVWSYDDATPFRIPDDREAAEAFWKPIMSCPIMNDYGDTITSIPQPLR